MKSVKSLLALTLLMALGRAHAVSISGQSLAGNTIAFETLGPSGTTVSFTLSAAASVQIGFLDGSTVVASLTQSLGAGAQNVVWNGLWLIGSDLGRKNGNFTVQIDADDGTTPDSKTIATPLQITSVDIHNVTVAPSLDTDQNPTFPYLIAYDLAKDAPVTITVTNSSGTVVRNLITNKLQLNETISRNTVAWNGLDDNGRAVPIGFYTVAIDASDSSNNDRAIQRTRTFAVASLAGATSDPQQLFEDNVFVYPNPVRNGSGTFQFASIRDGANITLRIYTISGDLVRDERFANLTAGNINTFIWDTTNQSGRKVGRGLYFYVVREEDPQGALSVTKKLAVLP